MRNFRAVLALVGALLGGAVGAQAAAVRTFTMVNSCPVTLFLGATAGSTGVACSKTSDCGAGQVCDTATKLCFWNDLKTPSGVSLDAFTTTLAANASTTISIPIVTSGATDTIWSGTLWAGSDTDTSTKRTLANVASGYCAVSKNGTFQVVACSQDAGPASAPVTQAEFTLTNQQDNYDITAINGVNLPEQMGPTKGGATTADVTPTDPNDVYYNCTFAGASKDQANPPQACSWIFAAKNKGIGMALVQYKAGATACSPSSTCPTGQVCGIGFNSAEGVTGLYEQCGVPLSGSWTAAQICVAAGYDDSNLKHVSSALKNKLACGGANTPLLQCSGGNNSSCYSSGAGTSCCGCPNWPAKYKPSGGNQAAANRCYNTNSSWTAVSDPWLSYVKAACPTMYSYPYDDATSSFHCTSIPTGQTATNKENYTITFCATSKAARVR